jgi:hypothetical protein
VACIQRIILTIEGQRKEQVQIALLDDGQYALSIDGTLIEVVRWKEDQLADCRTTAYAMARIAAPGDGRSEPP